MVYFMQLMKAYIAIILTGVGFLVGGYTHANQTIVTPSVSDAPTRINCPDTQKDCYVLLEPIGNLESVDISADAGEDQGIGGFINFMFEIGIGVAGVMGVVMLVIYGFQYAANDKNIATFEVLKGKITNVILGLLLLLGTFIILRTINPDLLIVDPEIGTLTLDINSLEGDPSLGSLPYGSSGGQGTSAFTLPDGFGIYCPIPTTPNKNLIPAIVKSFQNKTTYRYGGKGGPPAFSGKDTGKSCPAGTICLDCSGFVNHVYRCAGLTSPGGGTSAIFSGAPKVTSLRYEGKKVYVNNRELKSGDLLGAPNHHVFLYVGDGVFADQSSDLNGRNPGKGLLIGNVKRIESYFKRRSTYVYWAP